ncbi:HD-GYP domain-containing protein [Sediminispirochaeta bajacaliforniensis]|uniref:HD-GYP domain-containing protein n=1 Tax=Sediminispirochaeta bajacaliforniensis TaxID=148 RepID=UPI00036EBC9B|nr:HD-GYP domain-containing protein [Sediminispirochaeta bajacaliforniensis]
MKKYKVSELQDGMQFSAPVYIDEESLLVPEGVVIREKDIERLKRWEVEVVTSDGSPIIEQDFQQQISSIDGNIGKKLLQLYSDALTIADQFYVDAEQGSGLDAGAVDELMASYYPALRDSVDDAMGLTFRQSKTESRYAGGAINCMILSMAIGQRINLPGHRLMNLALAAFLHDIGMTRIPRAIVEKKERLTEDEMKAVMAHPIHSYRIITKELGLSEEVGRIVLLHHERWDGKGYPKGLTGKEIPVASRIISVADAYEAMIRDRPYRGSMIGYKAVRQVLNDNGRRYDSDILKVFIKSMGVYPPGSVVILQDGSVGKVIRNHRDVPLRPVVRVLVNSDGERLVSGRQREVDLLVTPDAFIARAVHPRELENAS